MRNPSKSDFPLEVDGIGSFVFARRTVRDRFRITSEYMRLTGGVAVEGTDFSVVAEAHATIGVLMVDAPDHFSSMLDPATVSVDEDADDEKISTVFFALRAKELSFRPKSNKVSEVEGETSGGEHRILVQEPVSSDPE
jgi:hypothetical protein